MAESRSAALLLRQPALLGLPFPRNPTPLPTLGASAPHTTHTQGMALLSSPGACGAAGTAASKNPFAAKPPGLVAPLAYLSCSVTQLLWAWTLWRSKVRLQSMQVKREAEQPPLQCCPSLGFLIESPQSSHWKEGVAGVRSGAHAEYAYPCTHPSTSPPHLEPRHCAVAAEH